LSLTAFGVVVTCFLLIPCYLSSGFLRHSNLMIANSFRATFTKEIFFLSIMVLVAYKITFFLPNFGDLHELSPIEWMLKDSLTFNKDVLYQWMRFMLAFYACTIFVSVIFAAIAKYFLFINQEKVCWIRKKIGHFLGAILQSFDIWDPLTQILRSGSISAKKIVVDLSLGEKSRVYTGTLIGHSTSNPFKYFTMDNVYIIEFDETGKVLRKLYKEENQGLLGRMIFALDKVSDIHFRWEWSGSYKHKELQGKIKKSMESIIASEQNAPD